MAGENIVKAYPTCAWKAIRNDGWNCFLYVTRLNQFHPSNKFGKRLRATWFLYEEVMKHHYAVSLLHTSANKKTAGVCQHFRVK